MHYTKWFRRSLALTLLWVAQAAHSAQPDGVTTLPYSSDVLQRLPLGAGRQHYAGSGTPSYNDPAAKDIPTPRMASPVGQPISDVEVLDAAVPQEVSPEFSSAQSDVAALPTATLPNPCYSSGPLGCRANLDGDGQSWINPYLERASTMPDRMGPSIESGGLPLPTNFTVWWDSRVREQTWKTRSQLVVGVDWLVQRALEHSPQVLAVSAEPAIQRTILIEEQANFDWRSFMNTTYNDLNDPVGNTLTTGNNDDRFKDHNWSADGGLRRKNARGGQFEAAQRLGRQANNSRFLFPNPQATTRLELTYTQPILNGAGKAYNESSIVLAQIDANSAEDEVVQELQEHLLSVTQAYWELYRARAEFLQQNRVLQEAQAILRDLQGRQEVDTLDRQVLRAKAAVANRNSSIARATTSIRNAESQLRLLVNAPELLNSGALEFTPQDAPATDLFSISIRDGLNTALVHRPDISRAIREIRTTSTQMGIAKNEILPKLDLLVSTYVAGLEGDSRLFTALGNQFSDGRPGYTVGLQFEVPLGNRAAQARLERRNLELARSMNQFRATVEKSLTETEVAIREVDTTYQEMAGRYESMYAADQETEYLVDRWQTLPGLDDSATLLLEDLLDSQERRAGEEAEFVRAQVNYSVALVRLRKAMGTLLRCEPPTAGTSGTIERTTARVPATSMQSVTSNVDTSAPNETPTSMKTPKTASKSTRTQR